MEPQPVSTLSERVDACNGIPIEPEVHPGPSQPVRVCSYLSHESKNVVLESCSGEQRDILDLVVDPMDSLERKMSMISLGPTPEPNDREMKQVSRSGYPVTQSIESCCGETVGNPNPIVNMKMSTTAAPVALPTKSRRIVLKSKTKKRKKDERLDSSPRRPKKQFFCEYCDKIFVNKSSLKGHITFHLPERPYRCDYVGCAKSYKRAQELRRHQITHKGVHNYECLTCGRAFALKQHLKTHILRHNNESLIVQCGNCAKIFINEVDLNKHKNVCKRKGCKPLSPSSLQLNRPKVCEICQNSFVTNTLLKRHMASHQTLRPYKCNVTDCGKSYKYASDLTRHAIVHSGEMKYKCMKCGMRFLRKLALKAHIHKEHPNEGLTWQCGLCVKIFVSEEDLSKHKRSYHCIGKNTSRAGGWGSLNFT